MNIKEESDKRTKKIVAVVTPKERDEFTEDAKRLGMSTSTYIRSTLKNKRRENIL